MCYAGTDVKAGNGLAFILQFQSSNVTPQTLLGRRGFRMLDFEFSGAFSPVRGEASKFCPSSTKTVSSIAAFLNSFFFRVAAPPPAARVPRVDQLVRR